MTSFFEFRRQQMQSRKSIRDDAALSPGEKTKAISVGELTQLVEGALKSGVPATLLVRGELSNVKLHHGSGHLYFTLKDSVACVDCVMWRSDRERMKLEFTDGEDVLVTGSIGVFAQRGRYQLYARRIEPIGRGALEAAFRKLFASLQAEGLFERERKLATSPFPSHITLITSRQTAALQDMLKVLRRFRWLKLSIFDVPVQGDGAAEKIAAAIAAVDRAVIRHEHRCEVILLSRGGGSLEDLWAFNEEVVARAIAAASVPIVTGIGHEIDTSIADLVADYHAHTPTEAAQVVTAHWRGALHAVEMHQARLLRGVRAITEAARSRLTMTERHELIRRPLDRIERLRQRLDDLDRRVEHSLSIASRRTRERIARLEARLANRSPRMLMQLGRQRLDQLQLRAGRSINIALKNESASLTALQGRLAALSPLAVLQRGYSITTKKRGGAVVRSAGDVRAGEAILTRTAEGEFESTVDDARQPKLFDA